MLNLVTLAPSASRPVWMVQLQVALDGGPRPILSDDDVDSMVQLLYQTADVRSVAVVPLQAGLAVAVGLAAPDAAAALERARRLTVSCARRAGLGHVGVVRVRVSLASGAGTA